jgi:sec-independent protein translocase protein TatB
MFDITSSKLLILGIVALLVIGPKDLPALLRTVGKYLGIIKRQAAEFRSQFDEAMRESELAQLRKEVEQVGQETEASIRAAEQSVDSQMADAQRDIDTALADTPEPAADPMAHDANAPPVSDTPVQADASRTALNGASPHETADAPTGSAERPVEKSGA